MKAIMMISFAGVFYVYCGYPLLTMLFSVLSPKPVRKGSVTPSVSILVAAYNEESCIEATLRNKLELDYPREMLEIIVVSDASTDNTDEIIRKFEESGIRFLRQDSRMGKTEALNRAAGVASGEILVFSDANSLYGKDAVRKLVQNFQDDSVGYVTGKMVYENEAGSVAGEGCSAYMRYENFLRSCETTVGSVVGVDGGIDAMRKNLYWPMKAEQLPDFILPLRVVEQGYRVVYEPDAILKEHVLLNSADEYRMRVRVSLRALWALKDMAHLLDAREFGIFSWQLLSHKVLRYFCFLLLILAYGSTAILREEHTLLFVLFYGQTGFYALALLSWFLESIGVRYLPLSLPYYFSLVNLASAHAFLKFLLGTKQAVWTPRRG